MATGNRRVELISQVWVQATEDTVKPFRLINESEKRIQWVAAQTPPASSEDGQIVSVMLTIQESMSRFDEMEDCHLYLLGETGTHVIVVD